MAGSTLATLPWLLISAVSGALAIGFGAFGAHGLRGKRDDRMLKAFETGAHYHLLHSIVLLAATIGKLNPRARAMILAGMSLFSGSLYAMVLLEERKLGAITPVGGVVLMAGWVALAL